MNAQALDAIVWEKTPFFSPRPIVEWNGTRYGVHFDRITADILPDFYLADDARSFHPQGELAIAVARALLELGLAKSFRLELERELFLYLSSEPEPAFQRVYRDGGTFITGPLRYGQVKAPAGAYVLRVWPL